ncbi:hypothetical protein, partial [Enterobacter hormaechei]|uniref:hypothetical protein n=2 Tax=Gammaproteobacteria TaxID=1236 RepID=UPI00203B8484
HRHETEGEILDLCCLPGEMETEVYVLVRRIIDGQPVQYIEQFAPTEYADIIESKYADSLLTYDGRNATATTMTLTA